MSKLNVVSKAAKGGNSDAPPVVLVHGAWHAAWCWQGNFLDYFAEAGFDTHAIDLRGHGDSPAHKAMRWNRISDYVDDVASVTEGFDQPPFVIGHSMGGFVAQHLIRRSGHLAGVGLLATVPSYGVYKTTLNLARRRPVDFIQANLTWSLFPFVQDSAAVKHLFLDEDASEAEVKAVADRMSDESYLGFLDMLFLNLPRGDCGQVPVLVVGGEKDNVFAPASQRATAERYGADCRIVADAPHDLMLSRQWREAADHFVDWMHKT